MDTHLICFLLTFLVLNTYAYTEWSNWPFAYPCGQGLCVPQDRYSCPCWHFQYTCQPDKRFSCCEDPSFFPMPNSKTFVCNNQTTDKKP